MLDLKVEREDSTQCIICDQSFDSNNSYQRHLRGLTHTTRILKENPVENRNPEKFFLNRNSEESTSIMRISDEPISFDGENDINNIDNLKEKIWQQFSDDQFYCMSCAVYMTGKESLKAHLIGKRHKKKAPLKAETEPKWQNQPDAMVKLLNMCDEPIIVSSGIIGLFSGLRFIEEYVPSLQKEHLLYMCNLCRNRLSSRSVIRHLICDSHRLNFLRHVYPLDYGMVMSLSESSRRSLFLNVKASEIERIQGRNANVITRKFEVANGHCQFAGNLFNDDGGNETASQATGPCTSTDPGSSMPSNSSFHTEPRDFFELSSSRKHFGPSFFPPPPRPSSFNDPRFESNFAFHLTESVTTMAYPQDQQWTSASPSSIITTGRPKAQSSNSVISNKVRDLLSILSKTMANCKSDKDVRAMIKMTLEQSGTESVNDNSGKFNDGSDEVAGIAECQVAVQNANNCDVFDPNSSIVRRALLDDSPRKPTYSSPHPSRPDFHSFPSEDSVYPNPPMTFLPDVYAPDANYIWNAESLPPPDFRDEFEQESLNMPTMKKPKLDSIYYDCM